MRNTKEKMLKMLDHSNPGKFNINITQIQAHFNPMSPTSLLAMSMKDAYME